MTTRGFRGLTLITAPDTYPLELDEIKAHLRIDHDDEDSLIYIYLAAAVSHVQMVLQRSLMPQVWEMTLDSFPPHWQPWPQRLNNDYVMNLQTIEIPFPPLLSIDHIRYIDAAGDEQEIDPDSYVVDTTRSPGFVVPIDTFFWPTTLEGANKVTIRFTVGYVDQVADSGSSSGVTSTVPAAIKAALLMIIGDLYENRESVAPNSPGAVPVPATVNALLAPYRIHALA